MPKKRKNPENPSGIILYAKRSGITSFSSLWSVKKALETDKVGHTGTLDSFAEGLLVVLSGHLTHLVSHVTSFRKSYLAVICFGTATDTLDPLGKLEGEGRPLTRDEVSSACAQFSGAVLQKPPIFSALHVDGRRASDVARSGEAVDLTPRQVFVYKNELLAYKAANELDRNSYALVQVDCSKGTYIRALARDMAESFGSVAHLSALRRTRVGPFSVEDAACYAQLDAFTIEAAIEKEKLMRAQKLVPEKDGESVFADIRNHFLSFTHRLAFKCGLKAEQLKAGEERNYVNGRPLLAKMFEPLVMDEDLAQDFRECESPDERAVFYEGGQFAGITRIGASRPEYAFVVPKKSEGLKLFSWADVQDLAFPSAWKEKGCALSVGSFDALHRGHLALIDAVLGQKKLVPGILLFRSNFRGDEANNLPAVMSFRQRLCLLEEMGVRFVIAVDFSTSFARTDGLSFMDILVRNCNLRYLAEGQDFRCGWKGSFGVEGIAALSAERNFSFDVLPDVSVEGERISSSRVRSAIQEADFALAASLLGRPFCYDCRSLRFTRERTASADEISLRARMAKRQVCPPPGTYPVEVSFGNSSAGPKAQDGMRIQGQCRIEGEEISLVLPAGHQSAVSPAEEPLFLYFIAW